MEAEFGRSLTRSSRLMPREVMAAPKEYRYLIETQGEPRVEGARRTHTSATIGYFPFPWKPLAPAEGAWVVDVLQRLFLPTSKTLSICLHSAAGASGDRPTVVDSLCSAASAMAEGAGAVERAYRLPFQHLSRTLFSQLFNERFRSVILFDPPSPLDLESYVDAVRRYYAAQLDHDLAQTLVYVPRPCPQWLDRLLRRFGLALGAPVYPPEDAFPDRERPSHILWSIVNEVDGVAFGFPDDVRVGLEIRAKGCRVAAFHEVLSQSAERHGIRAVRVGTLSDLVYHW